MQMDLDIWQLNFGCSWCLQQQIILLRDKPWLHACMHSQVVCFMLLYCRSLIEVRSGKSFIDIIVEHIEVQILYKSFLVFLPLVVNVALCLWIVGSQSFAFEKAFGFLKEHPHGFEDWKPWLGACFQMFWIQTAFDLIKKLTSNLTRSWQLVICRCWISGMAQIYFSFLRLLTTQMNLLVRCDQLSIVT
jgi:hypothetical protein